MKQLRLHYLPAHINSGQGSETWGFWRYVASNQGEFCSVKDILEEFGLYSKSQTSYSWPFCILPRYSPNWRKALFLFLMCILEDLKLGCTSSRQERSAADNQSSAGVFVCLFFVLYSIWLPIFVCLVKCYASFWQMCSFCISIVCPTGHVWSDTSV